MDRLDDITMEELQELREQIDEGTPKERVLAAIGRKQGDQIDTLAERHGVVEKTIRNWLDRFAEQPIEQAPYDAPRSGRPADLTDEEKEEFMADLHESPEEFGYDRQVWFPLLAYHHLKDKFGVEYSLRHIYRLLHEAGLSWRTARPRHYEADPEAETEFQETVQKKRPS